METTINITLSIYGNDGGDAGTTMDELRENGHGQIDILPLDSRGSEIVSSFLISVAAGGAVLLGQYIYRLLKKPHTRLLLQKKGDQLKIESSDHALDEAAVVRLIQNFLRK